MAAVENSKLSRRGFLASSAAVGAANVFPAAARAAIEDNAIHPFRVNIPEEQLVDLRRRITATRWPDKET
ncbi:MAG TPA: epoxide hydrolase, partial [Xanthobacteraceae bacterium]|nr:epoxide hydrolase [Xanthobacteraceae bacterium]